METNKNPGAEPRNAAPTNAPTYHPDATNDPLVGTQEHPDQAVEARAEPVTEAALWPTTGAPEKSHILAGILGILLGGLGVHRFYLHYMEVGAYQLVLSVLIFAAVIVGGVVTQLSVGLTVIIAISAVALIWIWGAVEGIMILAGMMPHDGYGHPLK